MSDEIRFSVEEITAAAQAVANNSEDGKVSLSEFTSALSRIARHEESRKSREILGRDVFGFKVTKKAG